MLMLRSTHEKEVKKLSEEADTYLKLWEGARSSLEVITDELITIRQENEKLTESNERLGQHMADMTNKSNVNEERFEVITDELITIRQENERLTESNEKLGQHMADMTNKSNVNEERFNEVVKACDKMLEVIAKLSKHTTAHPNIDALKKHVGVAEHALYLGLIKGTVKRTEQAIELLNSLEEEREENA
jgi:predicted  nucleic acid-binding Zn-ribbon protein